MQKIIQIIFIILIQVNLFAQTKDFKEITKIEDFKPSRIINLSDTINYQQWVNLNKCTKEKIKLKLIEKQKDIKSDTSNVTLLLYYGLKENVEIEINNTLYLSNKLINQSQKYAFVIDDFPNTLKTYEIGTLKRNTGIQELIIYFKNIERFGRLKIDTSYSQVYIIPEINIELIEFQENELENESNIPKLEQSKIKKMEDRILLNYRIPKEMHSW